MLRYILLIIHLPLIATNQFAGYTSPFELGRVDVTIAEQDYMSLLPAVKRGSIECSRRVKVAPKMLATSYTSTHCVQPHTHTHTNTHTLREFKGALQPAVDRPALSTIKLLKPTGHVMHQQFNIQQLYVLPTLYLCVLYLSENKQRLVPLTA